VAESKTGLVLGVALAAFVVGAVVASALSPDAAPATGGRPPSVAAPTLPPAGDFGDAWHAQTAVASYQSRLLRYAQRDASFAGARFAFQPGVFLLYGAGPPSPVLQRLIDSAPRAVDVRWVRVPYSGAQLRAARRMLKHAMPKGSVVEFAPNYGGILIGLHPLPQSARILESLYARAQRLTDIPVTFLEAGLADPM
jgi:hypothetical protein